MAITDGLVSYWEFNETGGTRFDSVVSSSNHLTVSGNVGSGPGVIAGGMSGSGYDRDFLAIPSNPSILGLLVTGMSLAGWFNHTRLPADGNQLLVSKVTYDTGEWYLAYFGGDNANVPKSFYFDSYTSDGVGVAWDITSNNTFASQGVTTGSWYHICVVISGTTGNMYINGTGMIPTGRMPGGVCIDARADLVFGTYYNTGGQYTMHGLMDQWGLWNRALLPSEVTYLYNNGSGRSYFDFTSTSNLNTLSSQGRIQKRAIRPYSDISLGSWTPTPIFSKIDEVSPDDSDYTQSSNNPSQDTFEVSLTPSGIPINRTNHNIRYRLAKNGSAQINMVVGVYQGTTLIGSGVHNNLPSGNFATGFSLTVGEASNITDYTNLRLRFTASTGVF